MEINPVFEGRRKIAKGGLWICGSITIAISQAFKGYPDILAGIIGPLGKKSFVMGSLNSIELLFIRRIDGNFRGGREGFNYLFHLFSRVTRKRCLAFGAAGF